MWDPSTIAIDKTDLSFFQGLDNAVQQRCCLVVYSGGDTGRQITLDDGVSTVGRSAAARLQIDGPGLSRLHAELTVAGDEVTLRDLGSANGSFVRDARLTGPTRLRDGDLVRLGSVVLKFYSQQSMDAALHDRVYRLAMVDAGTGVFNRRYLQDALRRELRLARQRGQPLAVISYDLDRFKSVNDQHGHATGDLVLRDSAALVQALVTEHAGQTGVLARLGGEEFVVLLPGMARPAALALAERLRAAVASHAFPLPTRSASGAVMRLRQTLSLGVAELSPTMLDGCDLLDAADRRLYQSKHDGRNRVSG